jgi:hypothetical protein
MSFNDLFDLFLLTKALAFYVLSRLIFVLLKSNELLLKYKENSLSCFYILTLSLDWFLNMSGKDDLVVVIKLLINKFLN